MFACVIFLSRFLIFFLIYVFMAPTVCIIWSSCWVIPKRLFEMLLIRRAQHQLSELFQLCKWGSSTKAGDVPVNAKTDVQYNGSFCVYRVKKKWRTNWKQTEIKYCKGVFFLSFGTEAEVKSTVWVSSGAGWLLTAESREQVQFEHFLLHQSFLVASVLNGTPVSGSAPPLSDTSAAGGCWTGCGVNPCRNNTQSESTSTPKVPVCATSGLGLLLASIERCVPILHHDNNRHPPRTVKRPDGLCATSSQGHSGNLSIFQPRPPLPELENV